MFASLSKKVSSAAAAGYASASAGTAVAFDSAKARVDTAAAGKKMVDEGGQPMVDKLLAKKASVDATAFDQRLVIQLPRAVGAYSYAAEKLRDGAVHALGELPAFSKLATDYESRMTVIAAGMASLQAVPENASVTPAERDAIMIVTTKVRASTISSTLSSGLAGLGVGGSSSEGTAASSSDVQLGSAVSNEAAGSASVAGAGAWLQGAVGGAVGAAKDRVETVKAAKKMVDEGGEAMVAKLLAKKASVDATSFDAKLVLQLRQAATKYEDVVMKLNAATDGAVGESPPFSKLIADYTTRQRALMSIVDSMSPVPDAATVSSPERDAIVYIVANLKVNDAKTAVTRAPESSGKAPIHVARENPELIKAAVEAAAKTAM